VSEASGKKPAAKKADTAGKKKSVAKGKTPAAKKPTARKTAAAKAKKPAVRVPELELHNLCPPAGATKPKRRLGLGPGSGRGRTAGRGHKGQKSRSGYSRKRAFEGGQMPLVRRLPKRGFTNIFRREYSEVNVGRLEALAGEGEITPELLLDRGVISKPRDGVKILGMGELKSAVTVRAHAFSETAKRKIKAAGGKVEVIEK